ncbi:GerMN domain-containing protein [Dehalobacter restrictus]|uniref:Sporulation protein n=1 Tax=Dehalobacter restrictus TaxID=55583 RepID=A0A857DLP1_9FIRM|nr:GerMN domain-containing protein [Dehalobacter restrictus]QHA01518.1 sporulation protein [Dehalobacter restrictus]
MRKIRLLLTFVLLIAAITLLVGCNILNDLIKEGGGDAPLSKLLDKTAQEDTVEVTTDSQQTEQTVKLYFADADGKVLIEENRTIPKTLSLARETVSQWLLGPAGRSSAYPMVNPQTVLLDIGIKSGIATVDLSKEFLEPYSNVAAETALYGLVNTLTQFQTVQIVKIRVEGKDIQTYRGIGLENLRYRNDLIGYASGTVQDDEVTAKVSPSEINLFEQ